jgi:hypothetical protein
MKSGLLQKVKKGSDRQKKSQKQTIYCSIKPKKPSSIVTGRLGH